MKQLFTALTKAFAEIEGATKGKVNPAFKSKYADLGSVVEAIKPALAKHDLFFGQIMHDATDGVCVETIVGHASGEQMSFGRLFVPASKKDAQGFGSALTYARRYSLMAAFGVPAEDDDGNAASRAPREEPKRTAMMIADADRDLITTLAPAAGKTVQAICDAFKVQSLAQLTASQATNVINRLRAEAQEPVNA